MSGNPFRDAVEQAIENELDSYSVDSRAMAGNGYITEVIAWRLSRDGFLTAPTTTPTRRRDHP